MQQKCLENETKQSGKLTQMFSELRSTLITSSDNGNANRMPWHVVVEPFSCCLPWQGGAAQAAVPGPSQSL